MKLIIVPLLFLSINLFAQSKDSLLHLYNTQTIYRVGDRYLKGNNTLSYQDLKYEFNSQRTQQLYKSSQKNLSAARILHYTSIAFILVAGSLLKPGLQSAYIMSGGGFIILLTSTHYRRQSAQFLDRAIWQQNKEVLFGADK